VIGVLTSPLLLLQAAEPAFDRIWFVIVAAVLGQAVIGALGLAGFVAVSRRFMDKEIPGQIAELAASFKEVGCELREMRREMDRHTFRLESLESWRHEQREREGLNDTWGGSPPRGGGGGRAPR